MALNHVMQWFRRSGQGHKKEIREREETIADKEKRIYDLKKKNQEVHASSPKECSFIHSSFHFVFFFIVTLFPKIRVAGERQLSARV